MLDAQRPTSGEGGSGDAEREWLARLDASMERSAHRAARGHIAPVVVTIDRPHPATMKLDDLMKACSTTRSRSGGPGGQHRNKVETHMEYTHVPTGVCAHAGERRSATENARVALWRLRLALAVRVRCEVPAGDARSELWKRRCVSRHGAPGRLVVSPTHEDYPAMLSEALDVLWATDLDARKAAARLLCTPSQLIKLIKDHTAAWTWLNTHRLSRGLHPLR